MINAWCKYDWANSAFATTIMAAVLPTFYQAVAGANLEGNLATVYWGYTTSMALLLTATLAPMLGAIADYSGTVSCCPLTWPGYYFPVPSSCMIQRAPPAFLF